MSSTISLADRFWAKVRKTNSCWLWTGTGTGKGHGELWQAGRMVLAHRISWELHFGPIPLGMGVLHKCDNPPCVRPDHLFLGTQTDNIKDAKRKGRLASGDRHGSQLHPERLARGEKHGGAKLTAAEVADIRREYSLGKVSQQILGEQYGVNQPEVSRIIRGETWAEV